MSKPYVVGTPNATEDVYLHVKPGRERAFILRYFRFNLPRLTKALLCVVLAAIAVSAAVVARSNHLPFMHADVALWILAGVAGVLAVVAAVTRFTAWFFGSVVSLFALLIYGVGVAHDAPFAWNGASIELAAVWNIIAIASAAFLLLNWMLAYGILVAWPKDQGFTD